MAAGACGLRENDEKIIRLWSELGGLQARKREGRVQGLPEVVTRTVGGIMSWAPRADRSSVFVGSICGQSGGVSVTHGDEVMAGGLLCLSLRWLASGINEYLSLRVVLFLSRYLDIYFSPWYLDRTWGSNSPDMVEWSAVLTQCFPWNGWWILSINLHVVK